MIDYKKLENDVQGELMKVTELNFNTKYIVYFIRFGTYGSYKLPNKIYVNVFRTPEQIAKTIMHEMIHLQVEPEVREKQLTHDQKEELVDSLEDKFQNES